MGRRLILDTNALIAYERRAFDIARLDDDDLAIAAITIAEYRVGIELTDTAARANERTRALDRIMASVDVLPYTAATTGHHAVLLAHVKRLGRPRGAHDLLIAAQGRQSGRTIVGRDARARFGELPGVKYLAIDEV